jgi:nucleotide-binding universal stress UspA family protein
MSGSNSEPAIISDEELTMKILVATDGSPSSTAAVDAVATRPWPPGTEVEVLTVIHTAVPFILDPAYVIAFIYMDQMEKARKQAPVIAENAAARLRQAGLSTTTVVLEGAPKHLIVEEAERWGADLIVLGTHGHGPAGRFLLGSVAHAVVLHAPCSVEVVRVRHEEAGTMER